MTSTDEQAFLDAIVANPDDHVAKLVFADWLDEHDQPALAAAYRWCGENGRHPQWFRTFDEWTWWRYGDAGKGGRKAELPDWLYRRIEAHAKLGGWDESNFASFADAMQAIADHLEPIP